MPNLFEHFRAGVSSNVVQRYKKTRAEQTNSFVFYAECSIFGIARDTNKRAKNKIFFAFISLPVNGASTNLRAGATNIRWFAIFALNIKLNNAKIV